MQTLNAQQLGWQATDFELATSLLQFRRWFDPALKAYPGGLGPGWRHNYDIYLTGTADHRIVHLPGERHEFAAVQRVPKLPLYDAAGSPSDPNADTPRPRMWRQRHAESEPATIQAAVAEAGTRLVESRSGHAWISADGTIYRFVGSQLASIHAAGGPNTLVFSYRGGRLSSVTDQRGNAIRFVYRHDRIHDLELPGGERLRAHYGGDGVLEALTPAAANVRRYRYADSQQPSGIRRPAGVCDATDPGDEETVPVESCNSVDNPPPPGFDRPATAPDTIREDIRPVSCDSYFLEPSGIERGQAIEAALARTDRYAAAIATVHSFPVADFLLDGDVIVVKSRDLTSASYADPEQLYAALMRDGEQIETRLLVPVREQGVLELSESGETTRITAADIGSPVLELVVQYASATPEQRTAIRRAAQDLAHRYGIRLRVVEIP